MMKRCKPNIILLILIGLIIGVWFLSWYIIDIYLYPSSKSENIEIIRGAFGGKFSFINSLFSGLAFAVIAGSLYVQNKELKFQQEKSITQGFQTTLFYLLKTQRQIADELNYTIFYLTGPQKINSNVFQGRAFFRSVKNEMIRMRKALSYPEFQRFVEYSKEELESFACNEPEFQILINEEKIGYILNFYNISKEEYSSYQNLDGSEKAKFLYIKFHEKFGYVYNHYLGHLYHVLCFLDNYIEDINTDKIDFGNSIKAQLSIPEIFLLYHHCHFDENLNRLVIKYNLLERFDSKDLIS